MQTTNQAMYKKRVWLGLVGLMLLASGCQSTQSTPLTDLKNSGFMSLWNTYADCKATDDLSRASADLNELRSASQLANDKDGFVLPLPTHLARLVNNPTSRVAVDVQAMTAACALHTGELALNQGHMDLARVLLTSVTKLQQTDASYYVAKAKALLAKLEQGFDISYIPR